MTEDPDSVTMKISAEGYLLAGVVVLVTTLFLGLLKLLAFCCVTRSGRWGDMTQQICSRHGVHCPTSPCLWPSRENFLPWYLANLVVDAIIVPLQFGLACYLLHATPLLNTPFSEVQVCAGLGPRYAFCIMLGHLFYRLVLVTVGRQRKCSCSLAHLHLVVAIATYVCILITREGNIYGALGMLIPTHMLFDTLRSIRLNVSSTTPASESSLLCFLNICRVLAVGICCFVVPVSYIVLSMQAHPVWAMSYVSAGVTVFAQTYFAIYYLVTLVRSLGAICVTFNGGTEFERQNVAVICDSNRNHMLAVQEKLKYGFILELGPATEPDTEKKITPKDVV